MLQDIVTKDSTDRSVTVRIIDAADGTPETAVAFDTIGIDLWYRREGAVRVAITEATLAALTTAHTDGGFLHVSDGVYRLDLPDAAFATGANYVDFGGTVTGMVVIGGRVRLVDANWEVANMPANVTQFGGTNGTFASGRPETNINAIAAGAINAAAIANAAIDAATFAADVDAEILSYIVDDATRIDASALNTASVTTIPAILTDTAEIGAAGAGLTVLATAANLATVAGYLDTEIAAILADTNELQTDWVDGGRLDLILDARSSQTSVDDLPTSAELATALGTADDAVLAQVALVKAKTDQLTFTMTGQVDANAESINASTVVGVGTIADKWRGA